MSPQVKGCKCFSHVSSNCRQRKQAWSTCFKCNTFFVLQVFVFPGGSPGFCLQLSLAEECVCLQKPLFDNPFLLTGSYELCQQCADSLLSVS